MYFTLRKETYRTVMVKATKQENFTNCIIFTGRPQPVHLNLSGRGQRNEESTVYEENHPAV